jgi:RHS repeat-associated protein
MPAKMPSDDQSAAASQSPVPQISLPKGGGAIHGIGEKFSTNSMTGTGSMSVPIAVTSARSGFGPQLSLTYDTGAGNGVFGMGWSLSLPAISRKTDKGIPRYRDLEESDVFILSGSEDLVRLLRRDHGGEWRREEVERDGFSIQFYRPRVEGLFARIEKWTRKSDGDIHWRSFTKDNSLTIYGDTAESRISDPDYPLHVFKWLISATYDAKGNAIVYRYQPEDKRGLDQRSKSGGANRYLKRILYGNRKPLQYSLEEPKDTDWMFEVVFDFGDEHYCLSRNSDDEECVRVANGAVEAGWPARSDPFSTYRSGFEIRTLRLCHRTLMFHHFPEELGVPRYLVRSTEFQYEEKKTGSKLTGVIQSGYKRREDDSYLKKSLPRLDLAYSASPLEEEFPGPFELKEAESQNLPEGIEGGYRWIDLNGEGISGVLSEQGRGWYYKRNLGGGRFGQTELIARKPASARLSSGQQQLLDIGGKGQVDLVELTPGSAGYYERISDPDYGAPESGWGRFRPFPLLPVVNWSDPNLRFVDLTGDGIADILITEDVALRWHPSLQSEGFGSAVRVPAPGDEEEGPRVVFSDPSQSIFLADMSGDGLTDIVRIRNGEVCYWPNLGYGRFGAKILMDRSPWFDEPGLFDTGRVRLADTDGSGTTDILYFSDDEIYVYLNESGNSLSPRKTLRGLPPARTNSISVVDFLGRGTSCLVWSSPLASDLQRPLRYVDLMRGQKPHLLTRISNNLGAETVIEYASSTEFYLADKAAGQPWVTPLPFPLHVVKRVETFDYVSQTRFVASSAYHHGFYDAVEREFRGFGRVDQMDTEEFGSSASRSFPAAVNEDSAWRVPPMLAKTWYHTGVFLGADRVSRHLAHEYYREPGESASFLLEDAILPRELSPEEAREACRALKGSVLRKEAYALDGSEKSDRPYTVSESNSTIRMFQPRGCNLHGVFFAHARGAVTLNYERKLYEVGETLRADPRVTHAVTLEVDDYGNVLKSASLAYGRRFPDRSRLLSDADRAKQSKLLATLTESTYTNAVNEPAAYRTPATAETKVYELIHLEPSRRDCDGRRLVGFVELRRQVARAGDGLHDLPFEDVNAAGATGPGLYRRLLKDFRSLYRSDALDRLLPLGRLESLALPGETYALAMTAGLIAAVFQGKLPQPELVLHNDGGYRDLHGDGRWWIPSGRVFFSPESSDGPSAELEYAQKHFFLPHRFVDAFGNVAHVAYDSHDLVPVKTRDAIGNVVQARLDYRVMQPRSVTDANGNRAEAAFDAIGMLAGTAVMGKADEQAGDSLEDFNADLPERVVLEHIHNPLANPQAILGNATTRLVYDLFAFGRTSRESSPQPAVLYSLARETHVSKLAAGERTKIQHAFSYSDGFAREIQKKIQAEPGPIPGHEQETQQPRWVGSGWTIFNNKNKPVRQYEPFFSATHHFEFAAITGVAMILIYDPIGRVAATLNPNHTFQKTVLDPWRQESWDANDTVLTNPRQDPDIGPLLRFLPAKEYQPTWYEQRQSGELGREEQEAAWKAASHASTPSLAFFDTLGRTFLSVAHNRVRRDEASVDEFYPTRTELDIQGNQRSVTDALGRVIMTYHYDLVSRKLHQSSADAGERWILPDMAGRAILALDSRDHRLRYEYDALRRPTALFVRIGDDREQNVERTEYGESQLDGELRNLRAKVYRQFDEAGVVTTPEYDFKGNLLRSTRQVVTDYRSMVDWHTSPQIEAEVFSSETSYDALNRPITLTAPDQSIIRPAYNEANLIERLDVSLKGPANFAPYVTNIDYNAKAQRELIEYGNGARTTSEYDPLTFRLIHLKTTRENDGAGLQDLTYSYDSVGNVSSIADAAQQTVYFKNQVVSASGDYVYDAVYRLIQAEGREHTGNRDHPETSYNDFPRIQLPLPGDGQAMRNYREQYRYDAVGNILELLHSAGPGGSWRRHYQYDEIGSNNRLTKTTVGQSEDRYSYDPDGNMTRMLHLPSMTWNFKNQLASTQTQVVKNGGRAETTYYVYNSGGQRVRKVTDDAAGNRRADRTYLGGFEMYREYGSDGNAIALERTTLHVMDGERRAALAETLGTEVTIRYQFDNHLGSSCLELDDAAAVITYEEYYPFGSTSYQAGRSISEVSLKRYRFTGKERDEETGFNYHGSRYCAPWLGRWTSSDPAGMSAGVNGFAYVKNNPIGRIDPTGLDDQPGWFEKNLGPASDFGQWVSHGDYFGSSFLQDDKKLQTAQYVATGVAVVAGTIATGGLLLEAGAVGGGGAVVVGGTEAALGTTAVVGTEAAVTTTAVVGTEAAVTTTAVVGTEAAVTTTAAATAGTGATVGLTASQATTLTTLGTAAAGAAATPQGQQILQEGADVVENFGPAIENALPSLENALPTLENEAQVISQEVQQAMPQAQSLANEAAEVVEQTGGGGGAGQKLLALGRNIIDGQPALKNFAERIGAKRVLDLHTPRGMDLPEEISYRMKGADQIHFNLEGMGEDLKGILEQGRRFYPGSDVKYTSWEFSQVIDNAELLMKTWFHSPGAAPVPGPLFTF